MKCINDGIRRGVPGLLCALLLACAVAGCGQGGEALDEPYDIYQTAGSLGISASSEGAKQAFFAEELCVASDEWLGTEGTNAEVAEGAGTFNLATNSVTYAKNLYEKLYPASTTKILTAYVALKYCDDLDAAVTVSAGAAEQAADSAVCGLEAGDVLTVRDLLYGMLLRSGNDAAVVIAEYISGDVESFAALMNEEARLLGASRSHFVNPNGLPNEDHYTCVYDLYLIMQAAVQNETFVEIIGTKSYTADYQSADGEDVQKTWESTNLYFTGEVEAPEGYTVYGGKTGTTNAAGYCLVLYSANPSGQPVISIVLKADGRSNLYLLMNQMLQAAI